MSPYVITPEEWKKLRGLPHLAQLIYLMELRARMDFTTGIVGRKPEISYQAICETVYVDPARGRHKACSGSPTMQAIRSAIENLLSVGLIRKIPADRRLVFFLPLARIGAVRPKNEQQTTNRPDQQDEQQTTHPGKTKTKGHLHACSPSDEQQSEQQGVFFDEQHTPEKSGNSQEKKPLESVKRAKRATRKHKTPFPEDFTISANTRHWAVEHGYGNLEEHLESFRRKALANDYLYADWNMAFENAVADDWAKLRQLKGQPQHVNGRPKTTADKRVEIMEAFSGQSTRSSDGERDITGTAERLDR